LNSRPASCISSVNARKLKAPRLATASKGPITEEIPLLLLDLTKMSPINRTCKIISFKLPRGTRKWKNIPGSAWGRPDWIPDMEIPHKTYYIIRPVLEALLILLVVRTLPISKGYPEH